MSTKGCQCRLVPFLCGVEQMKRALHATIVVIQLYLVSLTL